ncbi:MAG: NAD(P)/FAD-dependent oxidoreductase [Burkholderiales bacterium]
MSRDDWDAIVIGSGIGGLACAAALAKYKHRVLVLEQHSVPGGLTHTFSREGWTWGVGVHYLGDMGQEDEEEGLLEWISGNTIQMASMGAVYDTIHFPGGFVTQFVRPEEALKRELKEKFPASVAEIDAWFDALRAAQSAGNAVFALRAMPDPMATFYRMWKGDTIGRWCGRTTEQVLQQIISDSRLRSVLASQWGDYGSVPSRSCFGIHSVVVSNFFNGGYYPLGGAAVYAEKLTQVIKAAGGEVRVNHRVTELLMDGEAVTGVSTEAGESFHAARVVSDVGARNTVARLLPEPLRDGEWAREILALSPAVAHIGLYLGLEGEIGSMGASASNHWFYETWDLESSLWTDPLKQPNAPALYVSFPSLKDPSHDPGPRQLHTAEVFAYTDWRPFAAWQDSRPGNRPAAYRKLRTQIRKHLVAQFGRYFPALAPLIRYSEVSTPLSTTAVTGAHEGAMYGLEATPSRFLCKWLHAKTPVQGLYLAGQDVGTPGVQGSMMGGILAAAAIEPKLLSRLG